MGLLIVFSAAGPLAAEEARFWISTSVIDPTGPEAPSITGVDGSIRFQHIWAQPGTVDPEAPYHSINNPYQTLQNFSLNLLSSASLNDFLNDQLIVYNPALSETTDRFEFTYDSTNGLTSDHTETSVESGSKDAIYGLQGFTILTTEADGIGPECDPGDRFCAMTTGGRPAWLIASVGSRTVKDSGSSEFYLEIGANGMNHEGEDSSDLSVIFGTGSDPVYNASTNRSEILGGETSDFDITAIAAATTMDWLGSDGLWSDANWNGGGVPSWDKDAVLEVGIGDVAVTVVGPQQANTTQVNEGRLHIDADGALSGDVTVGAGGAISGDGWVAANLALAGQIAIDTTDPLLVVGKADLTGGTIGLTDNYTLPANMVSDPFVLVESFAGIEGTLATVVDDEIAPGYFLESIVYDDNTVTIQVRTDAGLLGDYNGDNIVNAADYTVWRNNKGLAVTLPGDETPGTVDQSDYTVWRDHYGETGGSGAGSLATVPEPATALGSLILACGCALLSMRRRAAGRQPGR